MLAHIVRRIVATIPVMAIVALFVFSLLYIAPGDPAVVIAGDQASPEDIEKIRTGLGLDRPFLVRFGEWTWQHPAGDLGTSMFTGLPVTKLIAQRLEPTLSLMVVTLILAVTIAVPIGVIAAWKAGTWIDRLVMAFAVLGFSVPCSWSATCWPTCSPSSSTGSRCRATRRFRPVSGRGWRTWCCRPSRSAASISR